MVPTMVDAPHVAVRRRLQVPRINWMEIAAGWALAVALQLVLLFLGFGLGVGAIDLKVAGEELRQQVASVLVADRPSAGVPMTDVDGDHASEKTTGIGAETDRSIGQSRVASVLPGQPGVAHRTEMGQGGSIASQVLDHAGPVVFWLAVWGAITWIASMFQPVPQSS